MSSVANSASSWLRRDLAWSNIFGPVLFYDLIRLARRSRYAWMRCLYILFLALMLGTVYVNVEAASYETDKMRRLAQLAESFFITFMTVQFFAVGLLTPAYTAGAIAEEKERKTLEFLLATDLRNREIVLGKQLSRLGNMALLILAGMPILSFAQFLGGVDPGLVLRGFAGTGLMMLGLGSLSILCSVYARKPRNAIVLTYMTMFGYFALSLVLFIMLSLFPTFAGFPLWFTEDPATAKEFVEAVGVANPIIAIYRLESVFGRGQALADIVDVVFRDFAIFYGALTLVCTVWSVARVRAVALAQSASVSKKLRWAIRRKTRRAVTDTPMVWKEIHLEPGLQLNIFGRIVMGVLFIISFLWPILQIIYYYDTNTAFRDSWDSFAWGINAWVRSVGTMVACLALLGVAFRASGSVTGERARQTFDSLLTSPLESNAILYGKWIGSVLSVRWAWLWLGVIWGLAVVTGGLHIVAVFLLCIGWIVYASFLAALGLWFSIRSRTTLQANVWTLLVTMGIAFGHWIPWFMCCLPAGLMGGGGDGMYTIAKFQSCGLTPPITLGWLAIRGKEFESGSMKEPIELMGYAICGLVVYGIAAVVFWNITAQRFRKVTHRVPLVRKPRPLVSQIGP